MPSINTLVKVAALISILVIINAVYNYFKNKENKSDDELL
jgi:uncharacterized membrane protein